MKRRPRNTTPEPPPPIAATPDPEYATRIDADRATLQFAQALDRPVNDYADSPLFGGDRQGELDV